MPLSLQRSPLLPALSRSLRRPKACGWVEWGRLVRQMAEGAIQPLAGIASASLPSTFTNYSIQRERNRRYVMEYRLVHPGIDCGEEKHAGRYEERF